MELKTSTEMIALPTDISNFTDLKTEIATRLDYYKHLVITDDSIKEGRADRAALNKLKTAIDTRRKEIKKQCMEPYNRIDAQAKELIALIDEPIALIDTQLATFEEARKEKKRVEIEKAYEAIVPDNIKDIIPLENIFDPRWLNAATKGKEIEEELQDRVKRTNADVLVLNTVEPEYQLAVREMYMRTYDIERAMEHKAALQEAAEAFKQNAPSVNTPEPQTAPEQTQKPQEMTVETQEQLFKFRLEFQMTMSQKEALKRFLVENNINFKQILIL